MEQHGPADDGVVLRHRHRPYRVLPHIEIVVAIPLVEAHGGQHFGDDYAHHLGEVVQHPLHVLPLQQLRQFLADALRRHVGEVVF